MKYEDLVKKAQENLKQDYEAELSLPNMDHVLKSFAKAIRDMDIGEKVSIPNLVTVSKIVKEAHESKNPQNGESVIVPKRSFLKFSASSTVRQDIE